MLSQQGFELGEGHLDGIEVRRVGRQKEEPGAARSDDSFDCRAFVKGDVVEDDDVTRRKRWRQLSFNVDLEDLAVHWGINDPGCGQAVVAQPGNERLCLPRPERGMRAIALTTW